MKILQIPKEIESLIQNSLKLWKRENLYTLAKLSYKIAERLKKGEKFRKTPEDTLPYLFYFFPKTFVSNYIVLGEIEDWIEKKIREKKELNFYDIASGTGSGTISFLYKLKKLQNLQNDIIKINIFLQDISPTALEIAKSLSYNFSKDLPYSIRILADVKDSSKVSFDVKPDLVVLSFSIYDIFGDDIEEIKIWCHKVLKSLDKSGLFIIIEPATKKINSRIIMEIRNGFREHVLSPCTHLKDCPLLKKEDWCHFGTEWKPPLYLLRAMNMIGLNMPNINFSFIILSKEAINKDEKYARVVSHRLEEKGKIAFWTCEKGSKNKYYVLKKNIYDKKIESIQMGDIILIQNAHQKTNGEYEITKDSIIEIKRKLIGE